MNDLLKSLPLSTRLILRDPVNLLLAIIPTIIALGIYFSVIYASFKNLDVISVYLRSYIHSPEAAGFVGKVLSAILIIFIFLLMSWAFVIVVGIIAAPFNSMLSSRIEKRLVQKVVEADKSRTFKIMVHDLGKTFMNEIKKLIFIVVLGVVAFFLNLFPMFYPLGLFIFSVLLAVQFVDYSWSRHDMSFGACLKDIAKNFIPYSIAGFFFLLLVTIPVINAFVPAWATSYFTILWLHRTNKVTTEVV